MFRSLEYNIKQGFTQLFRHRGMTLASIFAIIAMLLILGVFFVVTVNVNMISNSVKADYDEIEVFLEDSVTYDEAAAIMHKLNARPGVTNTTYRSQDDALQILRERWGESGYMLDSLGENPLPASILIEVDSLDNASQVATYAGTLEGIEDVQYYRQTVEKIAKITNFLQVASIIIMIFLVVVSIIIVSNTIRLTVNARAKEIFIMQYVGASNWQIRGPFLIEGILIGLIAAAVSTGLVLLIYSKIMTSVGNDILAIIQSPLVTVEYLTKNLAIIFACLGIAIGSWGSIISMRKFLNA